MQEHFTFSISGIDETGLVLVSVTDKRTGFVVTTALPNSGKQTASIMAFAGARYSRSSLSIKELFAEINGTDANEKLANIFRNYGHASVADMANLFAYIENIPVVYAFKFFYESSIGAGQERSSRYQDFSNSNVVSLKEWIKTPSPNFSSLDEEFQNLQLFALEKNKKWITKLTSSFSSFYLINETDKKALSALKSRVFDTARAFLPNGMCYRTSKCYITSAREWARLISIFKGSQDYFLTCLSQQLEILFAPDKETAEDIGYMPEASELIRYTTADETIGNNLDQLRAFLRESISFRNLSTYESIRELKPLKVELWTDISPGAMVIIQAILSLYPNLSEQTIKDWIESISDYEKVMISQIVFKGFNHHKQMGNIFRTNSLSFIMEMSIAEARDLVRHRSVGRFIPILNTNNYLECLKGGYSLPLYLTENPFFSNLKKEFEIDLLQYYKFLDHFVRFSKNLPWFPQEIYLQMLPFAHSIKFFMHASPKEVSYITQLRVRPGGHINYREVAYEMAQKTSDSDTLLSGLLPMRMQRPDPLSREEFIDRS